jgi:hypothetical protein
LYLHLDSSGVLFSGIPAHTKFSKKLTQMEEAPENGKESSHSAHAYRMNE